MLAPGEYLTNPVPPEQNRTNAAPPTDRGTTVPPPPGDAEQPEPRSFLLTLLRALGAIHT